MSMRQWRRSVAPAAIALTIAVATIEPVSAETRGLPNLTVTSGHATAAQEADLVQVRLGIDHRRATLPRALRETDAAVARLRTTLIARGVAPRDILATGLRLYRFYHQVHGTSVSRYGANRFLTVVIRDVNGSRRTIAAAAAAGARAVGGSARSAASTSPSAIPSTRTWTPTPRCNRGAR